MAGRKRKSTEKQVEEEDIDIENEDGNAEQQEDTSPPKRSKRSGRSKANYAEDGNEDDDSENYGEGNGEDEDEDDVALDILQEDGISTMCETGQIANIYVENFMCHRKFSLNFGDNVNFVTGTNGSGKSAIVAAIQLCLGSGAKTTGRGSNLSGMIREGSPGPAVLRVTLKNEGADAYEPQVYGNRIMVEREIFRNGTSKYAIIAKDTRLAKAKKLSGDKHELVKILTQFGIYVENPCCVLTQEESKRFLQGTEASKYTFFLKATGLQRARENLVVLDDRITQSQSKCEVIEGKLKAKRDVVKKLKSELKELDALGIYEEQIKEYTLRLLWLKVHEKEAVLDTLREKLGSFDSDIQEAREILENAENEEKEVGSTDAIRERIEKIQAEEETVSAEFSERSRMVTDKQKELNKIVEETRR
jgi:chromosome segregation ATPase